MGALEPVDRRLAGPLLSRVEAGSYTYLEIQTSPGKSVWAVILGKIGAIPRVEVQSLGRRKDFYSARLDRTFEDLYFATLQP